MKRIQRLIIVVIMFIIPAFLSGCWDSRELDRLSLVAGIGLDLDPGTGKVTVTYQSIVPSQLKSTSSSDVSGEQKSSAALNVIRLDYSTGSSLSDALNNYARQGSHDLFYQHAAVFVLGKEEAQQGIYSTFDTIVRNPLSRPNILIVISEEKASDILKSRDGMERIQAIGIANEIKLSAEYSQYPSVTTLEFANRLKGKTTAPIIPMVGIFEETGPEGEKIKKTRITGTAVFKGDRMVGKLNERESRGLLWTINKIKRGFVTIPEADMEIIKAESRIIPELQDDKIKITVEIDEESNLVKYKGRQDMTPEILREMEKGQAKEIGNQVIAAVEKSFSLNADVFGFGDAVHRKYKKKWKDLQSRWDDIYPRIEVVVKVKTHLNENGDINKALMQD